MTDLSKTPRPRGPGKPAASAVSVDLRPARETASTFVRVEAGAARAVRYSPTELKVLSVRRGDPGAGGVALLQAGCQPAVREALRRRDFTGGGLEPSDQFYLAVLDGQAAGDAYGVTAAAPEAVRELLRQAQALADRLPTAALDDAYVRSEPITTERYDTLRRSPKIRFVRLDALGPDLKPVVGAAITQPRDFVALDRARAGALLSHKSYGKEVFIEVFHEGKGAGQQLIVYDRR
jgi:hypothetical protein